MLSFANSPGNLFNRLGKLGLALKQAKSHQTALQPILIDTTNGIVAQYNGESDIQALMGSAYIGQLNAPGDAIGSLMQNIAQTTLGRMVFRDNPQLGQNLTSNPVDISIAELIRQMNIAGATVLAQTVTSTPTGFTGVGNGVINCSVKRPFDGRTLENSFAETVKITCTSDSYLGGGTRAGNEGFIITGIGSEDDLFAFDWPLGSNSFINVSAINGNANNSQGNLLTNSGFSSWTGGSPNNHSVSSGLSVIFQENSIVYGAGSSLRLTGDGVTLAQFKQQFATSSSGTGSTLQPLTQYSFNIFARRDAVAAGSGNLIVDLVDQNNNTLLDAAGNANTFTIDLTALTQFYASFLVSFRTPEIMPSQTFIRYRNGTALTNGRSVYLANGSLGVMQPHYPVGPYYAIHSGSIPFVAGSPQPDYATVVITNGRGVGGTLATFQTLFSRLFPSVYQNGFLLPSSSTPTLVDSVYIA